MAWTTGGLTASKGRDYVGQEDTIAIPVGGTSATLRLGIARDDVQEATEAFELRFTNLQNATFADGDTALLVTIEDDDRSLIGGVLGALGDRDEGQSPTLDHLAMGSGGDVHWVTRPSEAFWMT